jgi:hypothetical protein
VRRACHGGRRTWRHRCASCTRVHVAQAGRTVPLSASLPLRRCLPAADASRRLFVFCSRQSVALCLQPPMRRTKAHAHAPTSLDEQIAAASAASAVAAATSSPGVAAAPSVAGTKPNTATVTATPQPFTCDRTREFRNIVEAQRKIGKQIGQCGCTAARTEIRLRNVRFQFLTRAFSVHICVCAVTVSRRHRVECFHCSCHFATSEQADSLHRQCASFGQLPAPSAEAKAGARQSGTSVAMFIHRSL